MLWLLTLGTLVFWFVAALANFGGGLIDGLLIVAAAMLILQLWPKRKTATGAASTETTPLLALAPAASEPEVATADSFRRAA